MNEAVLDSHLRDGLRRLPVPAVGPEFDERVWQALRMPPPWYAGLWQAVRPAVASGLGAMLCMLGVIWLVTGRPIVDRPSAPSYSQSAALDWDAVESALTRPVITAASLLECVRTTQLPQTAPVGMPRRTQFPGHAARRQYLA